MKTLVVLFCVTSLALGAEAQDLQQSEVPSVVLNAFQQKFANAANVEWEAKGELYKAEFKVGSRGHDAWIDKSGKITKHKEDFPKKELPQSIQEQISTEFKSYKLDDADKIEMDGKIFYEVELDGSADDRKVLFTADGKVQENVVD
jgi:uncharacterized membrane protein YkoI